MSKIDRDLFFKIFGSGESSTPYLDRHELYTGSEDVEPLIAFSRTFKPEVVIEIGVQRGATANSILSNSPWIKRYIGIDIPHGNQTAHWVQSNEVPVCAGELASHDPRFELILRPNGSRDLLPDDLPMANLILIDGDHSYQGAVYDTELARAIITDGGVICWHDYGNGSIHDVTKLIDDINAKENDTICHIEGGMICFQIYREEDGNVN